VSSLMIPRDQMTKLDQAALTLVREYARAYDLYDNLLSIKSSGHTLEAKEAVDRLMNVRDLLLQVGRHLLHEDYILYGNPDAPISLTTIRALQE
jgi:hypothetical protein